MGVLSRKVNQVQIILAVEGRARSLCPQCHLQVYSIIYNDVEGILELLDLVSIAHHLNFLFVIWLEDAMSLYDFPNALLVLGESSILSQHRRLIPNCYPLDVIL
jgi:hypothetical protein